jgi:hypothetical protein
LRAGVITGVVVYVIAVALGTAISGSGQQLDGVSSLAFGMFIALVFTSPIMLLVGLVATIVRGTRMFGAGLLISTSLSILVVGGVCIALANQSSG